MSFKKALVESEDRLLLHFLEDKKIPFSVARSVKIAFSLLEKETFDLILCKDLSLLKKAKSLFPHSTAILFAEFPSISQAVEAIKEGALDYLTPPFSLDILENLFEQVTKKHTPESSTSSPSTLGKMEKVLTESIIMKKVLADVEKVAKSHASVFICGESGTGKEVVAHALHFQSPRHLKPFIKVNCAAIPETLIESEFFGHEKGSFTGALERRIGRFEQAHTGSLLLDEVTEIPLNVQAKLLRVIQEQEFERVGGSKSIRVDVRLIATSNRDMKEAIDKRVFRQDLYYRLNVVPIYLPPLRERKEDILPLSTYFLEQLCHENQKDKKRLSEKAKRCLLEYPWPGNIRQLINVLERTVIMDAGTLIEEEHLGLASSEKGCLYSVP